MCLILTAALFTGCSLYNVTPIPEHTTKETVTDATEPPITTEPPTTTEPPADTTSEDPQSEHITSDEQTPPETEQTTATEHTTDTEKTAVSTEIVVATFNIKHCAEGIDEVAAAIREVSADIIGLEEVDVNCSRSGNTDEPAELARAAGYPYYAFAKAISLGGGEYGTALLSRYRIESFEVIPLDSGNSEKRSVGHAVVYVEGIKLDLLVTHLSYEDRSARIEQMKTINKMLKTFDHYVILADLNCFDLDDINYLGGAYYVNRSDRYYSTFRRYSNYAPDNIVVSEAFTELSSGTYDSDSSDHRLLYATFLMSVE